MTGGTRSTALSRSSPLGRPEKAPKKAGYTGAVVEAPEIFGAVARVRSSPLSWAS